MGQKDVISKHLIKRLAVDLAVYLLGLDIAYDEVELLSTEQHRVEDRRADLLVKVTNQQEVFILHVEIQNDNDARMPLRMLRYFTDIALQYDSLPVKQYLIYIGKASLKMASGIVAEMLDYRYRIIDMHNIDYRQLLAKDTPDAIVLSILGDFQDTPERQAVSEIVSRLYRKLGDQPKRFREYFYMMEILSDNRHLKEFIKEAEKMITQVKLENLPSYELGLEKGLEKGLEEGQAKGISLLVLRLLKKYPPETVAEMLELSFDQVLAIKNKQE
jgi:predicted transposase YdaD